MNKVWTKLFILLIVFTACQRPPTQPVTHSPREANIHYAGRIDFAHPQAPRLSSSGAYFKVRFAGTECAVVMRNEKRGEGYGYVVTVLDGVYQGRTRVDAVPDTVLVARGLEVGEHTLTVCKATEAHNGYMEVLGIRCGSLLPVQDVPERKIEFIGNSITCGMGADTEDIPCAEKASWIDEHNAWLAYGPLTARDLHADWLLSSYSGIGLVRFWNKKGPTMGQVYDDLYLNIPNDMPWDFNRYAPDLVSICLGTNDFSGGDGSYERAALDSATFVNAYIDFIRRVRGNYPEAQICCLSSPMLYDEEYQFMTSYLTAIVRHFQDVEGDANVAKFIFRQDNYSHGCDTHPDLADHRYMADQLVPFFAELMGW